MGILLKSKFLINLPVCFIRFSNEFIFLLLFISSSYFINEYLKERRHHKRTSKYLFCNNNDKQLTRQAVNKEIKKIANEFDRLNNTNIAPRVSTHTFRHSLARYCLVKLGLPINQVKDLLRHSNIETTAKYLTTSQEEITEIRKGIIF